MDMLMTVDMRETTWVDAVFRTQLELVAYFPVNSVFHCVAGKQELLGQVLPAMEQTTIASPWLADKHNVQTYVDPLSKQFSQFIPINRSTRGCEGNTLDAAAFNAL
jgi:hypothetical protein